MFCPYCNTPAKQVNTGDHTDDPGYDGLCVVDGDDVFEAVSMYQCTAHPAHTFYCDNLVGNHFDPTLPVY